MFDVFFLSYGEPNAEENFEQLKRKVPWAIEINNVRGIEEAYGKCAQQSSTDMFYLVEGDTFVKDSFEFKYTGFNKDRIYIWRAQDPIYGISTNFGCIKIYSKNIIERTNVKLTSLSNLKDWRTGNPLDYVMNLINYSGAPLIEVKEVASEHRYNTSPYQTWSTIFRMFIKHRIKKSINYPNASKSLPKLFSRITSDADYAWYAKCGALDAEDFYQKNKENLNNFAVINDYGVMREMFNSNYESTIIKT